MRGGGAAESDGRSSFLRGKIVEDDEEHGVSEPTRQFLAVLEQWVGDVKVRVDRGMGRRVDLAVARLALDICSSINSTYYNFLLVQLPTHSTFYSFNQQPARAFTTINYGKQILEQGRYPCVPKGECSLFPAQNR